MARVLLGVYDTDGSGRGHESAATQVEPETPETLAGDFPTFKTPQWACPIGRKGSRLDAKTKPFTASPSPPAQRHRRWAGGEGEAGKRKR